MDGLLMIIPLRNIGIAGEIKDILPENMPAQGLTSARSMRIESQALKTYSNAREIGVDPVGETTVFGQTFWRVGGDGQITVKHVDAGLTVKVLFVDQAGGEIDITPAGGLTQSPHWYAVQTSEWFILTNGIEAPQFTTTSLPVMVDLPGWPANYTAKVIESLKSTLVAISITKDGTFIPSMLKWSHPISPGDTTTFWDFSDPTLLSGETVLQEPGRELVALQPFRDTCMVYFDRATWRMDFVGGQFVYDFSRVFNDDGCASPHGWANSHGEAFVFGHRDIYRHDGHNKASMTDKRLTKYIYDITNFDFNIHGEFYPKRNEIYFLIRTTASGDGDLMLIYNTVHDAWTEVSCRDPATGTGLLSGLTVGPRLSTGLVAYDDWTTEVYTDFSDTRYADLVGSDETVTLYGISESQSRTYDLDYSGVTPPATTIFRDGVYIEHLGIDLDELSEGVGAKIIYLNRVYPQIHGTGEVVFRFGTSRTANSPVDWLPSIIFSLDDAAELQDYAVDVRIAGRYLSYSIEPGPLLPSFSYTGLDLDVSKVGAV